MTVFEPDKAVWTQSGLVVDASVVTGQISVRWAMGARPAHLRLDMTLDADEADLLESMLMNARLWLRKSAAQHAEVAAADQLGDDADPVRLIDMGGVRVYCGCSHLAESHCEDNDGGCHAAGCRCTLSIWQVLRGREWPYNSMRYYPIPTETTTGRNPR